MRGLVYFLRINFSFLLILSSGILVGQNFSIEDVEINRKNSLKPEKLDNLGFLPGSEEIVYSAGEKLFLYDPASGETSTLVSLDNLNSSLLSIGEGSFSKIPSVEFISTSALTFKSKQKKFRFNLKNKSLEKIFEWPKGVEDFQFAAQDEFMVYSLEGNVYIQKPGAQSKQITQDTIKGIVNGEGVYRNEFGMTKGMFISPSGKYLLFYRKDQREVSDYPLVDVTKRVAALMPDKYPMAGMACQQTELFLYEVDTDKIIGLDFSATEAIYHTNPAWSRDEKFIYFQHLNRGQDLMQLRRYFASSGEFESEILVETDLEYVEPQHPVTFVSADSYDFIYHSARTGYNQLYLYNDKNKSLKPITSEKMEVTELVDIDPEVKEAFFIAAAPDPMQRQLYKVELNGAGLKQVTHVPGTHEIIIDKSFNYILDTYSSLSIPSVHSLLTIQGEEVEVFLQAENPIKDYSLGDVKIGSLKAADNETDLYYKMILPPGFDSTKQYPVVFYVYGGPHLQMVANEWYDRIGFWGQYFAQREVIFFTMDPRGSSGRGMAFEQVIHRQNGLPQLEDYTEGIQFLKSEAYIDTTRMGITGWSFGGYMTTMLMTRRPEVFIAGAAGGPVIDWKYYEVMYGERYMDTPEENPEGYRMTNLCNYAGQLKNDLLIVQGMMDDVVVPQHCLSFINACIENGTHLNFFVYPNHEHNVSGSDRVHLTKMLSDYFLQRFENQ